MHTGPSLYAAARDGRTAAARGGLTAAALRREALSSGSNDKALHRARYLAVVGLLGGMLGAESWKPLEAQDPARCRDPRSVCEGFDRFRLNPSNSPTWSPQMIRDSGRPIVPIFEGWFQNEDGTYTLSFGYASFNLEEALHIPLGPDNFICLLYTSDAADE